MAKTKAEMVTQLLEERNRALRWAAWFDTKADRYDDKIQEITKGEV